MSKYKGQELESGPMEINPRIQAYGDWNPKDGMIRINPKKGDVVNTIIHEKLHDNYPEMDHEKVYENAAKIESKMTLPEMAMELLDTHAKAMNPVCKPRDMVHTEVSNIISRKVN